MALKDSLRLESIYFNNLKSMMKMLKSWAEGTTDEKTKDIIENCIQADAAILLLYRNLGEAWNELMANIQKEMHDLQDLKETVDAYHDELNEKIDEVNNYLMVLIRELQERVTILEGRVDVLETQINIILDLVEDEPVQAKRGKKNTKAANDPTYHLEYHGEEVSYSDIEDMIEAGLDRVIWVRGFVSLLHIVPSEANTIVFTRSFYSKDENKLKKEKVTINSSDVVTYILEEKLLNTLPIPTSDDVGKVLTVYENGTKGSIIIPNQSFTFTGAPYALSDTILSLFTEGTKIIVTLNDDDYIATVISQYGSNGAIFGDNGEYQLFVQNDAINFYTTGSGSYTISANVLNSSYEWDIEPSVSYFNLTIYEDDGNNVFTIDKTLLKLVEEINNGKTIVGIVTDDDNIVGSTGDRMYLDRFEPEEPYIHISHKELYYTDTDPYFEIHGYSLLVHNNTAIVKYPNGQISQAS